jgi:methylase of polypeptide subunit release factors
MKTVGNLLQDAAFKEKFVLQKLLCLYLACTREELWTGADRELEEELLHKIVKAYDDYVVQQKPLEYVLGHVDFFGKEFQDYKSIVRNICNADGIWNGYQFYPYHAIAYAEVIGLITEQKD